MKLEMKIGLCVLFLVICGIVDYGFGKAVWSDYTPEADRDSRWTCGKRNLKDSVLSKDNPHFTYERNKTSSSTGSPSGWIMNGRNPPYPTHHFAFNAMRTTSEGKGFNGKQPIVQIPFIVALTEEGMELDVYSLDDWSTSKNMRRVKQSNYDESTKRSMTIMHEKDSDNMENHMGSASIRNDQDENSDFEGLSGIRKTSKDSTTEKKETSGKTDVQTGSTGKEVPDKQKSENKHDEKPLPAKGVGSDDSKKKSTDDSQSDKDKTNKGSDKSDGSTNKNNKNGNGDKSNGSNKLNDTNKSSHNTDEEDEANERPVEIEAPPGVANEITQGISEDTFKSGLYVGLNPSTHQNIRASIEDYGELYVNFDFGGLMKIPLVRGTAFLTYVFSGGEPIIRATGNIVKVTYPESDQDMKSGSGSEFLVYVDANNRADQGLSKIFLLHFSQPVEISREGSSITVKDTKDSQSNFTYNGLIQVAYLGRDSPNKDTMELFIKSLGTYAFKPELGLCVETRQNASRVTMNIDWKPESVTNNPLIMTLMPHHQRQLVKSANTSSLGKGPAGWETMSGANWRMGMTAVDVNLFPCENDVERIPKDRKDAIRKQALKEYLTLQRRSTSSLAADGLAAASQELGHLTKLAIIIRSFPPEEEEEDKENKQDQGETTGDDDTNQGSGNEENNDMTTHAVERVNIDVLDAKIRELLNDLLEIEDKEDANGEDQKKDDSSEKPSAVKKSSSVILYDSVWGGLSLSNPNEAERDDHLGQLGDILHSAAYLATVDSNWAKKSGSVLLDLVRDIANPSNGDKHFPTFRQKDFFVGLSWSTGVNGGIERRQFFPSKAIQAYHAIQQLGKALRNKKVKQLGTVLLWTEIESFKSYWQFREDNQGYLSKLFRNLPGPSHFGELTIFSVSESYPCEKGGPSDKQKCMASSMVYPLTLMSPYLLEANWLTKLDMEKVQKALIYFGDEANSTQLRLARSFGHLRSFTDLYTSRSGPTEIFETEGSKVSIGTNPNGDASKNIGDHSDSKVVNDSTNTSGGTESSKTDDKDSNDQIYDSPPLIPPSNDKGSDPEDISSDSDNASEDIFGNLIKLLQGLTNEETAGKTLNALTDKGNDGTTNIGDDPLSYLMTLVALPSSRDPSFVNNCGKEDTLDDFVDGELDTNVSSDAKVSRKLLWPLSLVLATLMTYLIM